MYKAWLRPITKSGQRPFLGRIDVFAEVPPVKYEKLVDKTPAQDSGNAPNG